MIAEFLNRAVVLQQIDDLVSEMPRQITDERGQGRAADDLEHARAALAAAADVERRGSSGQLGFEPPDVRRGQEAPPLDDFSFISHQPIISIVQSALEANYRRSELAGLVIDRPPADDRRGDGLPLVAEQSMASAPRVRRTDNGRRLFDQFSITDIRWVNSKIAEAIRFFRHKHAFNERPAEPVSLPDPCRLIVVGDWATGIPRARALGDVMRSEVSKALDEGLTTHVVHLGDVYYSGWEHEYRERLLDPWPVFADEADRVGSWTLNGNHDMYSGGHSYYNVALADPRFSQQQRSSFFSLVHPKWKILAVDTSWEDADLRDPQTRWLRDELHDKRKVMLLSHHQIFSAYDSYATAVAEKVAPILAARPIDAWFWGHEHRCITYAPHLNVKCARCVGHGGVPVYMWHGQNDPYPAPGAYEDRRFIASGLEHWAYFGFVVLDIKGDTIDVRYVDETANEHHSEIIA